MDRRTFVLGQPAAAAAASIGLASWGAPAAAQTRFKMQVPTGLPLALQDAAFVALPNGDLAALVRRGANDKVEIHVAAAVEKYERIALHAETALAAADEGIDFVAMPNGDIAAVLRSGASGNTELHVLDAGKGYKALRLQVSTALPASDRRWSFGANGEGDLVAINRLGASGKTEVHVLDAARRYARFKLQVDSALIATDSTWDFGVLAGGDVVAISRRGDSGKTELHVLDAARDYKRFKLQTATALPATDDAWKFAVSSNGDVLALLTRGAPSGRIELHLLGSGKG